MMTLNCALNTNKHDGTLTILLSILQDSRPENVCIWKVDTRQWYMSNNGPLAGFNKHIEQLVNVDIGDDADRHDPFSTLMTFSRYSSYLTRFHD